MLEPFYSRYRREAPSLLDNIERYLTALALTLGVSAILYLLAHLIVCWIRGGVCR